MATHVLALHLIDWFESCRSEEQGGVLLNVLRLSISIEELSGARAIDSVRSGGCKGLQRLPLFVSHDLLSLAVHAHRSSAQIHGDSLAADINRPVLADELDLPEAPGIHDL